LSFINQHDKLFNLKVIIGFSFCSGNSEILRENQRIINRAIREIEREKNKLQQSEKRVIVEIKKTAKQGQMSAVRIMAKDLVRNRKHVEKLVKMKTQLQTVSLRLQTLKSQAAMAEAMRSVTKAMMRMNRRMNLPAMQRIMAEFERQSQIMEMKEEIVSETMDDMMDDEDEEEETEAIVNQVLDEIGINLSTELVDTPEKGLLAAAKKEPTEKVAVPQAEAQADRELQERLENLRKNS
jgi:charged multivesicular body protein 2A